MVPPRNAADKVEGEKDREEHIGLTYRTRILGPCYEKENGLACKNNGCDFIKTCILGLMVGNIRKGHLIT